MLSRTMFTIEYIHQLRENTGYDPQLLERVIYAFGLNGYIPIELAVWAPILITAMISVSVLLHLEDG